MSLHARAIERVLAIAESNPEKLVAIVGPTATGKSDLALAVAEKLGGEIVSADSVQIYRHFDIGSGKPSPDELARVPHHLVSTHDPLDAIDAVSYAARAEIAIAEIRARGKFPIVCGGTFFWVRALLLGLVSAPPASPEIRERHRAIVDAEGRTALHDRLRAVDPISAERLHPNDAVRVGRALEVFELSGRPMSAWQEEHGFRKAKFDHVLVGIAVTPEALTTRISKRVDAWIATGWIDEVRSLSARGYDGARAMGSVGYAEVRAFTSGTLPESALRESIVRSTRIYARRQRTWLNHANVEWLEAD